MRLTEENYVEKAENVMKKICGNEKDPVTTTKLRNLLAMTAVIYDRVINCAEKELPQDIINDINYLKVRFVYEAGREETVDTLVKKAEILECLGEIGKSRQQYIIFSRYMEAIVAYRKYYGKIYDKKDE